MKTNWSVTIVMYHYIRNPYNSTFPNIKARTVYEFEAQLRYFKSCYTFITIDNLFEALTDGGTLPPRAILLTFDDGYIDHYRTVFPLLKKYNVSGCFYPSGRAIVENYVLDVNKIHFILAAAENPLVLLDDIFRAIDEYRETYELPGNAHYRNKLCHPNAYDTGEVIMIKRLLQRELPHELRKLIIDELFRMYVTIDEGDFSSELYMNTEHLLEMSESGMHIGSHGYEHYWLNTIPVEKQSDDIERSLNFLKSIGVELDQWSMCYPYGVYDEYLLEIINNRNCTAGFIVEGKVADISQNNPLLLPRLDTNQLPH